MFNLEIIPKIEKELKETRAELNEIKDELKEMKTVSHLKIYTEVKQIKAELEDMRIDSNTKILDLLEQLCDELGLVKSEDDPEDTSKMKIEEPKQKAVSSNDSEFQEKWLPVKLYGEDTLYEVSNFGAIRNKKTGRLKAIKRMGNRVCTQLKSRDKNLGIPVARLVLEAFGCIPYDVKDYKVIHRDGNIYNCKLSNLMWQRAKEDDFDGLTSPLVLRSLRLKYSDQPRVF